MTRSVASGPAILNSSFGKLLVAAGGVSRNVGNDQYFPNEQIQLYKLVEALTAKAKAR